MECICSNAHGMYSCYHYMWVYILKTLVGDEQNTCSESYFPCGRLREHGTKSEMG
jgi:hypothetical protein